MKLTPCRFFILGVRAMPSCRLISKTALASEILAKTLARIDFTYQTMMSAKNGRALILAY